MPSKPVKSNTNSNPSASYEALLKQVTERVWILWQEDMRRNRERGGKTLRR